MMDEAYKNFRRDWALMDGGRHDCGEPTDREIWHHAWRAAINLAASICDEAAGNAYQNDGTDGDYEMGRSTQAQEIASAIRKQLPA